MIRFIVMNVDECLRKLSLYAGRAQPVLCDVKSFTVGLSRVHHDHMCLSFYYNVRFRYLYLIHVNLIHVPTYEVNVNNPSPVKQYLYNNKVMNSKVQGTFR